LVSLSYLGAVSVLGLFNEMAHWLAKLQNIVVLSANSIQKRENAQGCDPDVIKKQLP